MPELRTALDWLGALPPGALLPVLAALAFIENMFPPMPADVLVAFGAVLAARAGTSAWPPFLAIWTGNVAGAMLMFAFGRRFGSAWTERRFHLSSGGLADARLLILHQRHGAAAFFVSRFIPGVRAVVPPVAGALGAPLPSALAAFAVASAIWYGAITWLAFRAGNNWDVLVSMIGRLGFSAGVVGVLAAVVLGLLWWRRRRRTP
jgi:membrane protein DedA with SNARE-associated domain